MSFLRVALGGLLLGKDIGPPFSAGGVVMAVGLYVVSVQTEV